MVRPGRDRLSGAVEVDEAYYGGIKKGKRGRGADGKALFLIASEDKNWKLGRIRLQYIEDVSGKSLMTALEKMVEPKSRIRTDGWKGYNAVTKNGFEHQIVDGGSCLVGED